MMRSARRHWLKRFVRSNRGAAAVEFALVAPMLFALIFSTLEAGWLMTQSVMLDHAVDRSVRQIRIGTLAGATVAQFRATVCAAAVVLGNCESTLAIELIPITTAGDLPVDGARCVNRASPIAPVLRHNPGARSQTVFVRACFVTDPLTPFLGLALRMPTDDTGAFRIISTSAFANEPPG